MYRLQRHPWGAFKMPLLARAGNKMRTNESPTLDLLFLSPRGNGEGMVSRKINSRFFKKTATTNQQPATTLARSFTSRSGPAVIAKTSSMTRHQKNQQLEKTNVNTTSKQKHYEVLNI